MFIFEPVANLATVGLVWAFSGDSGAAWGGLVLLVGLGMVRDAIQTRTLRGTYPLLKHLIFSPVKDILLLPVWIDAILQPGVQCCAWPPLSSIGRMTRLLPGREFPARCAPGGYSRVRKICDQNAARAAPPLKE